MLFLAARKSYLRQIPRPPRSQRPIFFGGANLFHLETIQTAVSSLSLQILSLPSVCSLSITFLYFELVVLPPGLPAGLSLCFTLQWLFINHSHDLLPLTSSLAKWNFSCRFYFLYDYSPNCFISAFFLPSCNKFSVQIVFNNFSLLYSTCFFRFSISTFTQSTIVLYSRYNNDTI